MDAAVPLELRDTHHDVAASGGTAIGGAPADTMRALRRDAPAVPPDTVGFDVARIFERDPDLPALPIVRGGQPVGLIERLGFLSRFAARYGRELYGRRPIARMMDREPLVVEADQTIDAVSQRLFMVKPEALNTGFIVAEDGLYAGIVTGIDLLQALARSLATSNERLREAQATLVQSEKLAALGALVAGIAHEINTPIGSALTAATAFGERARAFGAIAVSDRIRRSDIDRFVASALEASDFMHVNIHRASELIGSFKQIAVDQTNDARRRFALDRCLEDVLLSLQPRLRKAGVATSVDCPADVELDSYPGAVAQVLTNLVMNALDHAFGTRGSGRIAIAVTHRDATVQEPAGLEMTVADDGCGIPPELRTRVFDPFFTTRRGRGGTGLGLHIVYNLICQRLGGAIRVEEADGGGTRFVLFIPPTAP